MQYIHVRNLEKHQSSYKDRPLRWAKIHFSMVQGDPDCDMITNEIDWARLVKFILLEMQAKKPIPFDHQYLIRKGFNLRQRPMSLTIKALHHFVELRTETVTEPSRKCVSRVEESRVEKINTPSINKDEEGKRVKKSNMINDNKDKVGRHFVPPRVCDIAEYCKSRNNQIDPEEFHAFYESKGWMVGKNKMKDWKAAMVTWEKNHRQNKQQTSYPQVINKRGQGNTTLDAMKRWEKEQQ